MANMCAGSQSKKSRSKAANVGAVELGDSSQCKNDGIVMSTADGTPIDTTNSSAVGPISGGIQSLASIG